MAYLKALSLVLSLLVSAKAQQQVVYIQGQEAEQRDIHLAKSLEFTYILGRRFYNQMVLTGEFEKQIETHIYIPTLTYHQQLQLRILAASLKGDVSEARQMIQRTDSLNYHMYHKMCSPLDVAVYRGDDNLEMIRFLVENGADVNMKNRYGESPLYIATAMNHIQTADYLLRQGADFETSNRDGVTMVMAATYLVNIEILEKLIQYGADVGHVTDDPDFVKLLVNKPLNTCEKTHRLWDLLERQTGFRLTREEETEWRYNSAC